jgi:beta-lactamase superfamily II metal-dependent hydrolase
VLAVEMLPANHGDALWIEYGTPPETHHVLIDGGPPYAKAALEARLAQSGGHLELLVITHVDFDHVGGLVSLLTRLPEGTEVNEVWFNGWSQLPGPPVEDDLLGAVQGEMVSVAIEARGLDWNRRFGGGPVAASDELPACTLDGGLCLTVLAPSIGSLARLRPQWRKEVEAASMIPGRFEDGMAKLRERERLADDELLGAPVPDPDPRLLAEKPFGEDTSLANWSSIALLAEYDGRSCLLAGDAPPGSLLPAIEAFCRQRGEDRLKVDAVKLAHHGSKGSTSAELLERLDCGRYLVSTNGKIFEHPSPETLARAILHGGERPQLLFNYRTPHAALFDSDRLRGRWCYETVFPDGAGGLRVEV